MFLFIHKLEQKMTRQFLYRYYLASVSLCETRRTSGSLVFYTSFSVCRKAAWIIWIFWYSFWDLNPLLQKSDKGIFVSVGIISVRRDWYLLKRYGKNSFKIILSWNLINKKQVYYFHPINIVQHSCNFDDQNK